MNYDLKDPKDPKDPEDPDDAEESGRADVHPNCTPTQSPSGGQSHVTGHVTPLACLLAAPRVERGMLRPAHAPRASPAHCRQGNATSQGGVCALYEAGVHSVLTVRAKGIRQ